MVGVDVARRVVDLVVNCIRTVTILMSVASRMRPNMWRLAATSILCNEGVMFGLFGVGFLGVDDEAGEEREFGKGWLQSRRNPDQRLRP